MIFSFIATEDTARCRRGGWPCYWIDMRSMMIVATFVLGCATGAATSSVIGSAGAAAPPGVTRWEYLCGERVGGKFANESGAEGWEMVGFAGSTTCFKRPLP
jgi:hypothetical protein